MEDRGRKIARPRPSKLKFVNKEEVEEFVNIVELLKNNNFRVINHENDRFGVFEAFSFYVYRNTHAADKLKAICYAALKKFEEEGTFPCELDFLTGRSDLLQLYRHLQTNIIFEGVD